MKIIVSPMPQMEKDLGVDISVLFFLPSGVLRVLLHVLTCEDVSNLRTSMDFFSIEES